MKRGAVTMVLQDEDWMTWTNAEIARQCHVDSSTVDGYRKESLPESGSEPVTSRAYTTKHGTQATMRTKNIGKHTQRSPQQESPSPDEQHGLTRFRG